ncbi:unnamed protein product [Rhizopus microsporus]
MNMQRSFQFVRTYATKSKTPNLKFKPSVPVKETKLAEGITFIERQPVVPAERQATAAPLLRQRKQYNTLGDKEINEIRQLRIESYCLDTISISKKVWLF